MLYKSRQGAASALSAEEPDIDVMVLTEGNYLLLTKISLLMKQYLLSQSNLQVCLQRSKISPKKTFQRLGFWEMIGY